MSSLPRDALLKVFSEDWEARQITYDELKPKTLAPHPNMYIVDVREPEELAAGRIPGAVNVPLSAVLAGAFALDPTAFSAQFGFNKPCEDQELVVYCKKGKRSSIACDSAKKAGYNNIAEYKGSWLDWVSREGIE
ncbi:hypothetical protein PHLGIDRAFT_15210 [Phlebiopsis gigantea 11061_1 CR5-6]|uniref:Rhodanese domain-containing protein n=1 Tax=Phlebiopsis gigantea (strain 11061_1 CR5-6) TaxID=745531 RepID=A0A0C3NHV0_PHLG1|nr:hypothetical protein PHLGIDRAFT_15210 [Phlebiopsis gigantea 11061_1 CR5-6]